MLHFILSLFLSGSYLVHANDVVIPLTLKNGIYGAGQITLPCTPDNRTVECKLDTGMNISYFKKDVFDHDLKVLTTATFSSVTGSAVSCDIVDLPDLRIGNGTPLAPITPAVCPSGKIESEENLIGVDAFAGRALTIDVPRGLLTLHQVNGDLANKFDVTDGHIVMEVTSALKTPVKTLAMFDTGASLSTVDIELVKAQPNNYTIVSDITTGTDVHGNPIESHLVVVGYVDVGGVKVIAEYMMAMDFTNIKKFAGPDVQMILGYNVIRKSAWDFDMRSSTWAARPQ